MWSKKHNNKKEGVFYCVLKWIEKTCLYFIEWTCDMQVVVVKLFFSTLYLYIGMSSKPSIAVWLDIQNIKISLKNIWIGRLSLLALQSHHADILRFFNNIIPHLMYEENFPHYYYCYYYIWKLNNDIENFLYILIVEVLHMQLTWNV